MKGSKDERHAVGLSACPQSAATFFLPRMSIEGGGRERGGTPGACRMRERRRRESAVCA